MFLLDTNVISELRKHRRANPGVLQFVQQVQDSGERIYLSVITLGELRRGVDIIRHRGDSLQADQLEGWLDRLSHDYANHILDFGREEALLWGRLRVPHHEHAIDKQIAATALIYDLTLVTRNIKDFTTTGVKLLNPFA